MMNNWQRLGMVVLSAGLIVLTFPPYGIYWLALVAWIPLLLAMKGASGRVCMWLGLLHGMLVFGGTLCWLVNIFSVMAVGLWMILAMFSALFGLGLGMIQYAKPGTRQTVFLVPLLWTGIEYFRCEVFTLRFPWITPGTGWTPGYLDSLIGVYGVSALILFAGLCLVERKFWLSGVAFLALILSVFPRVGADEQMAEDNISLALVQSEECYFRAYADMTARIDDSVDVILWPEYAISNDLMSSPQDLAIAKRLLKEKGAKILVAGSRTDLDDGDYYNTALTIGRDGELGRHFKNRPVHFFRDGKPGTESAVIETPLGRIGTPVCFDCDYVDVVRRAVAGGAELLLVPSMDAVSWGERQHLQHAELFRHRAAENRRYVAVAATSGRSQVIDPWGEVVSELPLMDDGVMIADVRAVEDLTLFTRGGWMIGPLMMWAAGVVLVSLTVISVRQSQSERRKE